MLPNLLALEVIIKHLKTRQQEIEKSFTPENKIILHTEEFEIAEFHYTLSHILEQSLRPLAGVKFFYLQANQKFNNSFRILVVPQYIRKHKIVSFLEQEVSGSAWLISQLDKQLNHRYQQHTKSIRERRRENRTKQI